jgi:hypothetical protein
MYVFLNNFAHAPQLGGVNDKITTAQFAASIYTHILKYKIGTISY